MFFLIDKPLWITSFDVIRNLKKILWTRRIGHTGTLDPLATGCLLIATHQSTKLIPYLENIEKTYRFTVDLRAKTDSLDAGTPLFPYSLEGIRTHTEQELIAFIKWQTEQIPPSYSALHIDGKRAYELARQGEQITLPSRQISVKNIIIHTFTPPVFDIELTISSGGYIRSFAPVIGRFFWVEWGYITRLERTILHTHAGDLSLDQAQTLAEFDPDAPISYKSLFPDILMRDIPENIYTQLLEGRIIKDAELEFNIWQKVFLKYENIFTSLVESTQDGLQIIRNDV
jgi:tRNA pseudouridine55 synthase